MSQKLLRTIVSLIAVICWLGSNALAQGVTTASINGFVLDNSGKGLEGATVVAVHNPTSTTYGTIAREEGQFNLPNVRVGGPYTVTVSYVGFEKNKIENLYLTLGQKRKLNFELVEEGMQMEEVLITATSGVLSTKQTGAQTNVSEQQINSLPTVSRDLTDFTRLTPQSTLTEDGDGELGFSVGGQNNRFNSIFIDGAISNDVFGLTDQGTNGGQAGISPISMDAIEQFNIVVSPYDVTIGGFTGAGVNAVTRSGSNNLEASVYYLFRNEKLAGKTPTDDPEEERVPLPDFSARTAGFRVGGPIVKNKVFFFVNAELERRTTPLPFNFNNYNGASNRSEIQAFEDRLLNVYGYDAGGFENNVKRNDGEKFLAKLDFNLNDNTQLTLRHSYTEGRAEKVNPSTNRGLNFNNSYEFFPSVTNSTALELNTVVGNTMANNLIIGYTSVRDDRDPLGGDFPQIVISDGDGEITVGSEPFSTANNLEQDVVTLTNNFNIYQGRHSITLGTHNEFYKVLNLFVRQNYGVYEYNSLADFMNDAQPNLYIRSYTIRQEDGVDGLVGDAIDGAAAQFSGLQLGFYVQDEFQATERLSITGGLRLDIPMFLNDPAEDTYFNNTAAGLIGQFYDLQGARAGQMPKAQLMWSPRIGFNLDLNGTQTSTLRGGIGLFTSRLPLVWAGGSHTNNGLNVGGVFEFSPTLANGNPITFRPDPTDQYTAADFGDSDAVPSGQMDLFAENLRFPQVLRGSIALDQKLPWDMVGTVELMYTKTLNSVIYQNVNLKPAVDKLDGVDNRDYFNRRDDIDDTYDRILLGTNTNKGYTMNFSASLTKAFSNGLSGTVAYSYGYAEVLNDLTSSQNSSQWRNHEVVGGKNNLVISRSDFSQGSRVLAALTYRAEYADALATTVSIFYNGQSGEVFSYTYTGSRADQITNQDSRDFTDLIYVPASQSEIAFADEATAAQQWAALDAFIEQDPYLSTRRGMYAERNGARAPFQNIMDLRVMQDFWIKAGGKKHQFQATLDIFNFTNMVNKNWGRRYRSVFNGVGLVTFEGFENRGAGDLQPTFSFNEGNVTDAEGNITTKAILNIDDNGTPEFQMAGTDWLTLYL